MGGVCVREREASQIGTSAHLKVRGLYPPGPWRDDLHAYEPTGAVPHLSTVLHHLPLLLNFAYAHPAPEVDPTAAADDCHPGSNPGSRRRSSSGNGGGHGGGKSKGVGGSSKGGGGPKAGHLVTIEFTGLGDPGTLLEALTLEEYITFEKHNMEHKAILLDRLSREKGYLVKMIAVRQSATGRACRALSAACVSLRACVCACLSLRARAGLGPRHGGPWLQARGQQRGDGHDVGPQNDAGRLP